MAAEQASSKRQAWFCTTGLPTDVVIEIGETSFHLHKFPLMNKSKRLHQLITEHEQKPRKRRGGDDGEEGEIEHGEEEEEEAEEDFPHIGLADFPGGVEIFEVAAKFCYGVKIEMTPSKAVPIRCAAEYLEMTEEFAEENLVARTERYLANSIFRNLKDCVRALKSCENLLPLAEDLGIVPRCVEAIAARAATGDLRSLFSWPLTDGGDNVKASNSSSAAALRNGTEAGIRRKSGIRASAAGSTGGDATSWFEELTALRLPIYMRVISAMKARDLSPEVIEGSLISYAKRSIAGLSRSNRHLNAPAAHPPSEAEQRELLETIAADLPQRKQYSRWRSDDGPVTTRLLSITIKEFNRSNPKS